MGAVLGWRELRETAAAFLDGLLSDTECKTGWMLSEEAGHGAPYRVQALLVLRPALGEIQPPVDQGCAMPGLA
jgi:hypothetical protein